MRIVVSILLSGVLAACSSTSVPTPTGTECPSPDPLTFGYTAATTRDSKPSHHGDSAGHHRRVSPKPGG